MGAGADYILAGVFSGLATATKYPAGGLSCSASPAAHLGASWRGRGLWRAFLDPRIYVAAVITFLAFFLGTPYTLLDWAQTLRDYTYHRTFVVNGYSAMQAMDGGGSFCCSMPGLFRPLPFVIALPARESLWSIMLGKRGGTLSLVAFIAATFIALIRSHQLFYRYILIPFPAMVVLAAILVADLIELAGKQ